MIAAAAAVGLAVVGGAAVVKGTGAWTRIRSWVSSKVAPKIETPVGHECKDEKKWQCPYDLHDPRASRWMAARELGLLEQHIRNAVCAECITKHFMTATGLYDEAAGLEGGTQDDREVALMVEALRAKVVAALSAEQPVEPMLQEIRKIRRATMMSLGFGIPGYEIKES